jgi:2-C-methyl-D-erythritol 2,4-cyclodiphosphate synthase
LKNNYRTGIGFDVHAFVKGRKLIIGGVEIPYDKGLLGHSDADVLLHAICDAILGALALGDIGRHFPDSSPDFKDAESSTLLKKVYKLVSDEGYSIGNIDSIVAMQAPKIAAFISQMQKKISDILETETDNISIKATTTEKLGFVGRQEGVSAFATVLLIKK